MDRAAQATAMVRDGLPGEIILAFTILSALRGPAVSLPSWGRGLKCVMFVGAAVGVDSRSPHGERRLNCRRCQWVMLVFTSLPRGSVG